MTMSIWATAVRGRDIPACLFATALAGAPAFAGAPFRTDDPGPVETGHWEVNLFTTGTAVKGATAGIGPALEVNYGAFENVQLHVVMPFGYSSQTGRSVGFGYADTEFGIKYRVIEPGDDDWYPEVAVFPLIEAPTGNQHLGLSTGHVQTFLPLWLQKEFGPWTVFGGGGYWVNPGLGNKDWWFAGVGVSRKMMETLSLGGEVFNQTANVVGGKGSTGFNIGLTYDFSENLHLLTSVGRGVRNAETTNRFSYYLGMQMTF